MLLISHFINNVYYGKMTRVNVIGLNASIVPTK